MRSNDFGRDKARPGWRRREFLCLGVGLLVGCGREKVTSEPTTARTDQAPLKIVTTVGMVADLVRQVGGPTTSVEALMGPGVDPHLYKVTAEDLIKLQRADLVFYSGLHLEGKMQDVLASLGGSGRKAVAVTSTMPPDRLLRTEGFEGSHDPHVWFDVETWSQGIPAIVAALTEVRPSGGEDFRHRGEETRGRLRELHAWVKNKTAEVPKANRILVTSHDAFNYFGRTYGFQVVALQGVSTVTEAGLADMAKLVDFIRAQRVRAIFVESSVPHTTIERISRDAGVTIGGELFSDAMGSPGQRERDYDLGTYDGMIRHNVNSIVDALR